MKNNKQSLIIITAAILTSMPRWVIALLAGEGILVPDEWKSAWIIISALLAASMAVVEGFAFAYIFRAWRNQNGKAADTLLYLALTSALAFVCTLSPSMAASVRGITLSEFIKNDIVLLLWTTSLALSTILIVVSVGYSEKVSNVDPQIQEYKSKLSDVNKELNALKVNYAQVSALDFLVSGTKKDRVFAVTKRWPDMPTKAVAILCDTSETYVSQYRNKE